MRTVHVSVVSLIAVGLVACGVSSEPPPEATSAAAIAPACSTYPLLVPADPLAESRARAAIAKISPAAQVVFSPGRGTLSFVTDLHLSVGNCPRGRSADAQARAALGGNPDAFAVAPSEWVSGASPTCDQIAPGGTFVTWTRATIGGQVARKDVFSYRLRKAGPSVWIDFVSGAYLPPASASLATEMAACPKFDPVGAERQVRESALPYGTYSYCIPTGDGKYAPEGRDAFGLGSEYWEWDDSPGGVALRRTREATLTVNAANFTPALLASDANCPVYGIPHVGFKLRFDAVGAKVFESQPGIDCIVCAH